MEPIDEDAYPQTKSPELSYEELRDRVNLLEEQERQRKEEEQAQEKWVREQEEIQWGPRDPNEIEEPKPVPKPVPPTCRHLKENGCLCGSLAISGRDFCGFHLRDRGRRLKMARARARGQRLRLQLPPLEDLYAVQVGIMQVLNALGSGQLEKGEASVMLSGLRQASTNLRCPQKFWDRNRFELPDDQGLEVYGDFEDEFDLPEGLDPDTPPEVAFPEPEPAAITEERANLMEVTPLDIQLMELQQHEGPEAMTRKLKQLDAAEDRRYRRAQAQLAHARHVVRAAAQNAAREVHLVERSQAAVAAAETKERADASPSSASVAGPGAVPVPTADEATKKAPQAAAGRPEEGAAGHKAVRLL